MQYFGHHKLRGEDIQEKSFLWVEHLSPSYQKGRASEYIAGHQSLEEAMALYGAQWALRLQYGI